MPNIEQARIMARITKLRCLIEQEVGSSTLELIDELIELTLKAQKLINK